MSLCCLSVWSNHTYLRAVGCFADPRLKRLLGLGCCVLGRDPTCQLPPAWGLSLSFDQSQLLSSPKRALAQEYTGCKHKSNPGPVPLCTRTPVPGSG